VSKGDIRGRIKARHLQKGLVVHGAVFTGSKTAACRTTHQVTRSAIAIFVASFEADAAVDRVRLTALQLLHQVRLLMVPD